MLSHAAVHVGPACFAPVLRRDVEVSSQKAHTPLVIPAEAQALADVRGYALANRIDYAPHAWQRMRERGAKREDVREALATATVCHAEPKERWRVEGRDKDGDAMAAIVVFEDGVLVVTLF